MCMALVVPLLRCLPHLESEGIVHAGRTPLLTCQACGNGSNGMFPLEMGCLQCENEPSRNSNFH
jgi:hypothetical protein